MEFNEIQIIKRKFFAHRNGITADVLRKGGSPFQIIFGLTLPQISAIARECRENKELALQLWSNRTTRCSMLLAPMLMPVNEFTEREAMDWAANAASHEVADVLCIKLLSKVTYKEALIADLLVANDMSKYVAVRLMFQLVRNHTELPVAWIKMLKEFTACGNTHAGSVAKQLLEELEDERYC